MTIQIACHDAGVVAININLAGGISVTDKTPSCFLNLVNPSIYLNSFILQTLCKFAGKQNVCCLGLAIVAAIVVTLLVVDRIQS